MILRFHFWSHSLKAYGFSRVLFPYQTKIAKVAHFHYLKRTLLCAKTSSKTVITIRMCCSFYQYLPMIKSGPTGYHNLPTSLLPAMVHVVTRQSYQIKIHLMKLHHLSPFFLYNPIKTATHSFNYLHWFQVSWWLCEDSGASTKELPFILFR